MLCCYSKDPDLYALGGESPHSACLTRPAHSRPPPLLENEPNSREQEARPDEQQVGREADHGVPAHIMPLAAVAEDDARDGGADQQGDAGGEARHPQAGPDLAHVAGEAEGAGGLHADDAAGDGAVDDGESDDAREAVADPEPGEGQHGAQERADRHDECRLARLVRDVGRYQAPDHAAGVHERHHVGRGEAGGGQAVVGCEQLDVEEWDVEGDEGEEAADREGHEWHVAEGARVDDLAVVLGRGDPGAQEDERDY